MTIKYIHVHDQCEQRNMIFSYVKNNMSIEKFNNIIYKFFDKDYDNITNRRMCLQNGVDISKFDNIGNLFIEKKEYFDNANGVPVELRNKIINVIYSYVSEKKRLEHEDFVKKNLKEELEELEELEEKKKTSFDDYIKIYYQTLTSRETKFVIFEKKKNPTVRNLKEKIENITGIPIDSQHLIFSGKSLEEDYELQHYNIKDESKVHLVLRLRGGMFTMISCGNCDYNYMIKNVDVDLDNYI